MSFLSETAATELYLRSTIKGSVALAAFTSTVEPLPLPRGTALPAVGYTQIHAADIGTLAGVRVYRRLDYRISAIIEGQTILTIAQMDSIMQGLFGNGQDSRVGVQNQYGTILSARIIRTHSLHREDPVTFVTTRYQGFTVAFEVVTP